MIEVELTDVGHGGVAIGRAPDGRAAMVRFGLPGETVKVHVTEEKKRYLKGDAYEVVGDPSPHRVAHPWPEAGPGGVGGADLGHVEFSWQQEWKTRVLRSQIRRIGGQELTDHLAAQGIEPRVEAFAGDTESHGWHTRTRVDLTADRRGRLGMYREGTHDVIALAQLPIADPRIVELGLVGVKAQELGWRFNAGTRVKAVAPSASAPVIVVDKRVVDAQGRDTETPFVTEKVEIAGHTYTYRVRADGFWQIHREAARAVSELVISEAGVQVGDHVLELYAGAGLFTAPLARAVAGGSATSAAGENAGAAGESAGAAGESAGEDFADAGAVAGTVRGLEGNRLSVEAARANLRDYPRGQVSTAKITPRLIEREGYGTDILIADPPRTGLGIDGAGAAAACDARRIVLISCDVAAMARDVATMVDQGRRVVAMHSLDMFPNTHHFEVVTTLA